LDSRGEDNPLNFDEAIDEIQCEILEFCACEAPEVMTKYIRDSLHHINIMAPRYNNRLFSAKSHLTTWKKHSKI